MNRITILVVAGLSIATSACATQPQPMTKAQNTARQQASFDCQYPLAVNARNYDAAYLASGRPAVDEHGNPYGLSLRGYVAYTGCMGHKGFEIADGRING